MRTSLLSIALATAAYAAGPDVEALLENGHYKRARELAEAAVKANPNDARAAWLLARVRLEFQNADEGLKYAELAVKLDPHVAAYHRTLADAYTRQIGRLPFYKQMGQSRKIRSELEAALAIAPNDSETLARQIDYLLEAPGIAGGDKRKAAAMAEELVRTDPGRGYLAMARVAQKQNEKQERILELYQKAAAADSRNPRPRLLLASYYSEPPHQDFRLMESHAAGAVESNPERIAAYRLLAYALAAQKRTEDLGRLLARAEALAPDDLSPYVFAARAMVSAGLDLDKAEQYFQKYLGATKEPEPGAPNLAGVHRSLGLLYERQGRKGDAVTEFGIAVQLKPDFELAKQDLKKLK